MALFLLLPHLARATPMWLILLGVLGLTYWECREQKYERKLTLWWLSFVFLTHFVGYLVLRVWVAIAQRRATR